jgi:hypothetical protein
LRSFLRACSVDLALVSTLRSVLGMRPSCGHIGPRSEGFFAAHA